MVVSEFKSKIVCIYSSCFMYLAVFKDKLNIQVNMQKEKEQRGEIGPPCCQGHSGSNLGNKVH